jgi:hypothetical protein
MQQRYQNPEADDKITIKALIKGLTPGPTTSHSTRKKPKTIDELFRELEEYILSDDDHRRRVVERNEARQGNREMTWRPQSQNLRNINNVENPQPNQNNRLLTVNSCIKVCLDSQAYKSPVVVKGPFFPRVVNPRYRIRGTNVWCKSCSSKAK